LTLSGEVHLVLIVGQAPFGRSGFFGAIRGCAQEFFKEFTPACELFELKYARLAHTMSHGHYDPDFGKPSHKQKVFEWVRACPLFYNRLDNTKEGRWFQIVDRSLASLPWWPCLDLVGCYMATVSGWAVRYVESAVLADQISSDAAAEAAPSPDVDGPDAGGVVPDDDDVDFETADALHPSMPGSAQQPDGVPKAKAKAAAKPPPG
jgi:hypothetical protein